MSGISDVISDRTIKALENLVSSMRDARLSKKAAGGFKKYGWTEGTDLGTLVALCNSTCDYRAQVMVKLPPILDDPPVRFSIPEGESEHSDVLHQNADLEPSDVVSVSESEPDIRVPDSNFDSIQEIVLEPLSCMLDKVEAGIPDCVAASPWVPCKFPLNTAVSTGSQEQNCQNIDCSLRTLLSSLNSMTTEFSDILKSDADSSNFDADVLGSFLKEIVVLVGVMLSRESHLPLSWNLFFEIGILQTQLFNFYMESIEYHYTQSLLWNMLNTSDFQKKILQRCICESVEFEDVMSEIAPAFESMLSLQECFLLNLIKRLQQSPEDQFSTLPIAMEC